MSPAELIRLVGVTWIQIFAILNPPSVVPTMLSLTEDLSMEERRYIVRTASIAVFAIMSVFALAGDTFLRAVGVSLPSLKFGGSILLFVISVDMLKGVPRTRQLESEELAVVPLATPLLVGPGTIATLIILSASLPAETGSRVAGIAILLSAIVIVVVTTYLVLRYSLQLVRVLGVNGTRALGRFMAIIIAGVAAEMMHSALHEWIASWRLS
ncbi:MAG TPA: NAAT family transporter [Candidatus Korarchaeota archaeon]|nr:NAAT family transporter [Candidatus Korarchaeota archaeon]